MTLQYIHYIFHMTSPKKMEVYITVKAWEDITVTSSPNCPWIGADLEACHGSFPCHLSILTEPFHLSSLPRSTWCDLANHGASRAGWRSSCWLERLVTKLWCLKTCLLNKLFVSMTPDIEVQNVFKTWWIFGQLLVGSGRLVDVMHCTWCRSCTWEQQKVFETFSPWRHMRLPVGRKAVILHAESQPTCFPNAPLRWLMGHSLIQHAECAQDKISQAALLLDRPFARWWCCQACGTDAWEAPSGWGTQSVYFSIELQDYIHG